MWISFVRVGLTERNLDSSSSLRCTNCNSHFWFHQNHYDKITSSLLISVRRLLVMKYIPSPSVSRPGRGYFALCRQTHPAQDSRTLDSGAAVIGTEMLYIHVGGDGISLRPLYLFTIH